jgi:O-antigen/teichoic acid export membrane protein
MNKIFKNSLFNIARVIIVTPVFFILVPYIISKIGTEGYGLWALTGVIGSYQAFVNFGLTESMVRFVARAEVQKEYGAIGEYVSTAMLLFLSLSVVIVTIIIVFKHFIVVSILGIKRSISIAEFLIVIAGISSIINLISGLFKSIIDGVQRMDISNIILTIQVILSAAGMFFVLEQGYGLTGMAYNLLIVSLISLGVNMVTSKIIVSYSMNPFIFKYSRLKEMFSYSINLQLASLIRTFIEPINKIIISRFFPLSYVGYYEIALKFCERITQLIRSSLAPLFPAATEIYEKYGIQKIESLRNKSSKYLLSFVTILYVIIILLIPDFIKLWLGPEMQIVSGVVIIFLIGSFFSLLATPVYIILLGTGHARDTLFIQIFTVLINIAGIILFSVIFGYYGFCAGFSLSMIIGFFITHYYYKVRFGSDIEKLSVYKIFYNKKIILSGSLFLCSGLLVLKNLNLKSYFEVLIFCFITMILYILTVLKFKIFTIQDIELLFGKKQCFWILSNIKRVCIFIK